MVKVHTSPVEFGVHLVASTGCRVRVWSDRHRYSPVCASMSRPPWSSTVSGLMLPVGVSMPALIVAPGAPAAAVELGVLLVDDGAFEEGDDEHAARIEPSSGTEMPTTVPRRTKSRRERRAGANSSLMWLAISPWPLRRPLSLRRSMGPVFTESLQDSEREFF